MGCQKCGACCKTRVIDITFSDILRWADQKRWDILCEVSYLDNYPRHGIGGFYIEKSARAPKQRCPFLLDTNLCSIHKTKPSGCSDAPLAYETFPECSAFEKPPNSIIQKTKEKQIKDIAASRKYRNIVMNILWEARRIGDINTRCK